MQKIRITKEFRFDGAHSLLGYDGKCRYIHGHSYILYVTVSGFPAEDVRNPKNGMLMDFSELKRIVSENIIDRFDHALVLRDDAPLAKEIQETYNNVILLPFQPTCENLVVYFADTIKEHLPGGITLVSLKLHETATSYAEWFASDN